MCQPTFPPPSYEFLTQHTGGNHQKLQIEPIVPEPKKEICTHDDWKWSETQEPFVPPRPAHQHVECVSKHNLRDNERHIVVHLAPIPTPVGINATVHHELHIMHFVGNELIVQRSACSNYLLP